MKKCTSTAAFTCQTNPSGSIYWLDASGQIINESNISGVMQNEYAFFGRKRVARRDVPTGNKHYYFSDHLGSASIVTNATGTIQDESDYYPYGGEIAIVNSDPNNYKFTGKERDSESGLDNFGARFDASNLGRFMSVDPVYILKQKLVDPQQWDMFAYVRNTPLRFVDPKGEWAELPESCYERKMALEALRRLVGPAAAQYLYDNIDIKTGKHYLGIYTGGPDGKGHSFASINAAANKLSGIVEDTYRGATVKFDAPGTQVGDKTIGSLNDGRTPAVTDVSPVNATIHVTSGDVGTQRAELQSNGQPFAVTLADVFSHEIGHVDSTWYHDYGADSNGDAVRMENQTRQLNGEPLRRGHDVPDDVQLTGSPY